MKLKPYPKPEKRENKQSPGYWVGGRFVQRLKQIPIKKSNPKRGMANILIEAKEVPVYMRPHVRLTKKGKCICSDGNKVTEGTVKNYVNSKTESPDGKTCQCGNTATSRDHTISQRMCKILHKSELCWDQEDIEYSCDTCHHQWESYKSGLFEKHSNVIKRMLYVKKHDQEGFQKRLNCISDKVIIEALK